jgi:hypothetical protein
MAEIDDNEALPCYICGASVEWETCPDCGGEGETDRYEDDPNWYEDAPDDERFPACEMCDGKGGWTVCLGGRRHADAVLARRAAPASTPDETPQRARE